MVRRERLIGYLWPEHPGDAARHLLSESLYILRKTVGEDMFVSAGDELALDPATVRSDLADFLAALDGDDPERAVAAYGGPFLDGFVVADAPEFERWAEEERDRHARAYARALEQLAESRETEADYRGAAEWWKRLARHDPFSGRIALRIERPRGIGHRHDRRHNDVIQELGHRQAVERTDRIPPVPESTPTARQDGFVDHHPARMDGAAGLPVGPVWRDAQEAHRAGHLLGFGIDSFIETSSGLILLWRLQTHRDTADAERAEARALKLVGLSLLLLAGFGIFNDQGARFGDSILAANHILLQFISFSAFFLDGFAFVTEALAGRAFGARQPAAFTLADQSYQSASDSLRDRRQRYSAVLTYYPSEFSKLRVQYNHDRAQFLTAGAAHGVYCQFEILFGAHGASHHLTDAFVQAWRRENPGSHVIERDLAAGAPVTRRLFS